MRPQGRRDLYIAMDITDRCNLRCAMCVRTASGHPPGPDLTVDQFRTIAKHGFHRAVVLALSCVSEPLLSRSFAEVMTVVKDYRVPATEIVTNGMLLDEARIMAMIEAGISRVIISIDGATPATYDSIRLGADFERLLSNLRLLQTMKRERRVSHPLLRLNFVMMRRNIHELPALIELAHELGAAQVTAQHVTLYEGGAEAEESLYWHQDLANRKLMEAHRLATQKGMTFNAPSLFSSPGKSLPQTGWLLASRCVTGLGVVRDFGQARLVLLARNQWRRRVGNRKSWCHFPWEIVFLDPHANVRPCVSWGSEPVLGSCLEQSLDEIWAGPAYSRLREELVGMKPLRDVCLHCPAIASGRVDDAASFEKRTS